MDTKRSVSVAIVNAQDTDQLLLVRRPPDDEDLPGVWGLPAVTLRPGEDWLDGARRAAREKLGVELKIGREINRGQTPRPGYTLEMRLFEARISAGEPRVLQSADNVTNYRDWRWAEAEALRPAAVLGSLCCRLYLEANAQR
jgi:ADP-ribose pyrophosphatase YjhB (NUDIX family)